MKSSKQIAAKPAPASNDVAEADCHKQASDLLTRFQLVSSTPPPPHWSEEQQTLMMRLSISQYEQFAASDGVDSVLASLIVAVKNATMDCFIRATRSDSLPARELELKNGFKGASVLPELTKAFDERRGRGKQTVSVGNVNIESGGQAIVGNVKSEAKRARPADEAATSSGGATSRSKIKRIRLSKHHAE
jgi:hypothetical protein